MSGLGFSSYTYPSNRFYGCEGTCLLSMSHLPENPDPDVIPTPLHHCIGGLGTPS